MMRIYERYIGRQVLLAFIFILFAFCGLFFFFDLIGEMQSVGRGNYSFTYAVFSVLLKTPSHFYEIIPVAALISAIYVFAQMAANSEFTILRASGLSPQRALGSLLKVGVPLVILTFVIGEFIGPYADQLSERVRLQAMGNPVSSDFRSGVWVKDTLTDTSTSAEALTRFINVGRLNPDATISDIKIYEFDSALHLRSIRLAETGTFVAPNSWRFTGVTEMQLIGLQPGDRPNLQSLDPAYRSTLKRESQFLMRSELTPRILSVLLISPERMSTYALFSYIRHLRENSQDTQRYQIAFWRKVFYPFAVIVMLMLSLPFGYLRARTGAVGVKVFGGIMLGMSFQLFNTLFSHIGTLNTWPAVLTAATPGMLYLILALLGLRWVDRH